MRLQGRVVGIYETNVYLTDRASRLAELAEAKARAARGEKSEGSKGSKWKASGGAMKRGSLGILAAVKMSGLIGRSPQKTDPTERSSGDGERYKRYTPR